MERQDRRLLPKIPAGDRSWEGELRPLRIRMVSLWRLGVNMTVVEKPEILQVAEGFAQASLAFLDGLYRYAMTLSHNHAEAEDLVQETYFRALRASSQVASDSNLKCWLYAILRNAWSNKVRDAHGAPHFGDLDGGQDFNVGQAESSDDPYVKYASAVERERVRAAVDNLPQQHREVIVLHEFEGLSYQEIGIVLDCPPGTVMSRLSRARERLREALSDLGALTGFI